MAVTSTIPQIWAARLTHFLNFFSAFTPNATREWEGVARMGNTVKIPTQDRSVTLQNYSRTADLNAPTNLTTSTQDLLISESKAFNFALEDLDAQQNAIPASTLLDNQTSGGGMAVAENIDEFVAGLLRANTTWASAPGIANFDLKYLADIRRQATALNLPRTALVQIVPPELIEKIDDAAIDKTYGDIVASQLIGGSLAADPVANMAFVGVMGGVRTYVSNSIQLRGMGTDGTTAVSSGRGTTSLVYVYDPRDLGLVVQTDQVESYRLEKRFATGIKGLINYGAKILNGGRMQRYIFRDTPTGD